MDTSKEYIKMCDCPEIQDKKPDFDKEDQNFVANFHHAKACPTHGKEHLWTKANDEDFYCVACGKELVPVDDVPEIETYEENGNYKCVWLPRQDQLQDIVGKNRSANGLICMAENFRKTSVDCVTMWCADDDGAYFTMEKFWIMLVMKKTHKKKWDGNEWVT